MRPALVSEHANADRHRVSIISTAETAMLLPMSSPALPHAAPSLGMGYVTVMLQGGHAMTLDAPWSVSKDPFLRRTCFKSLMRSVGQLPYWDRARYDEWHYVEHVHATNYPRD